MVEIPSNEQWYVREVVPDPLEWFMYELAQRLNVPAGNVGLRGNRKTHFRGGHRSYNFIKYSEYCTNRTYTVSRTPGDRNPTNKDAIAAGDLTAPISKLIWLCKRVDLAARSGLFEGLTEWYGNDDGDNRVDGFDNIANVVASSDPSHLWHIHFTFDRGIVYVWAFFRALIDFIFEEEDMGTEIGDRLYVPKPPIYALPTSSQHRPDISAGDAWALALLNAEYAAKTAKETAVKVDALIAAADVEVQRDAEDRVLLLQIQDAVNDVHAGDPTKVAELIVQLAGLDTLSDDVIAGLVEAINNIRLRVESPPATGV